MRAPSDLAVGSGDDEVGPLLIVGVVDLVHVVQELADTTERVAVHLIPAGRLLEVERRDDLRVVGGIPVDRAAAGPDRDEGDDEQGREAPACDGHLAATYPSRAAEIPPERERGGRGPPLSISAWLEEPGARSCL